MTSDAPAAGWYADPQGIADFRWWTGTSWTADTRAKALQVEQLEAAGVTGRIRIAGEGVVIEREGVLAKMNYGMNACLVTVPVASIVAIQFRPASSVANGFLRLVTAEDASHVSFVAAVKDRHAVTFKKKQQPEFDAIRDELERHLGSR